MTAPSTQEGPGPAELGRDGRFHRQASRFRDWVTADGSSGFPAAPGRYHLYVSLACPWAHRTVILRRLKGLEQAIGMSVVDPIRDDRGWAFRDVPGATGDPLHGWSFLSEAYAASDPSFAGRVSVPVLWDREAGRIVNNESADILRMLGTVFAPLASHPVALYPDEHAAEIDALNER
ncbi:MAG TPA: glutathione S-transferase family protein, partial [Solirubrobacteraceae bacterium]|nr:glutathione S-transferase family protein [Solirubrobacteraceae bacterium]